MPAHQSSVLKLKKMRDFRFGGIPYNFAYLVHRRTGEPLHEVCGFSLTSSISGKHNTLNSSISIVEQLKLFFEELVLWNNIDWRELSDETILQYLYQYRYRTKGMSGRSLNLQRHAIQSFYDWAYRYCLIEKPKDLEIGFEVEGFRDHIENPKPHVAIESQYISKSEFETLLTYAPGNTRYILQRNELVLMLGYFCGVRTHELTYKHNFNVDDLLNKIELATIENKKTFELTIYGKGRGKARNILIPPAVFKCLQRFLTDKGLRARFQNNLPLFLSAHGKPISGADLGSTIFRKAKALSSEFLGKKWQNRSFHSLRHTYATNLATWCAENGYDWRAHVPTRMGHTHYSASQIYVEVEALMNNRSEILSELMPTGPWRLSGRAV